MKVLIATPAYGGMLTTDYAGSLLNTLRWLSQQGIAAELYFMKNESLISRARNACASYFLKGDCDKLLFIDADQAWHPEDVGRLLRSSRTLVGGTYPKKTLPIDLNFTPLDSHALTYFPGGQKDMERYRSYAKEADAAGEIEVRHLATGFMLIDRKVLTDLKEGVPTYLGRDNQHAEEERRYDFFPAGVVRGSYESEDWFFCSQAREAGHPPYLNVHVIVDHIGPLTYSAPRDSRPKEALK